MKKTKSVHNLHLELKKLNNLPILNYDDSLTIDDYEIFFDYEDDNEDDNEDDYKDDGYDDYLSPIGMNYIGNDRTRKKQIIAIALIKKTKSKDDNLSKIAELAFKFIESEKTWHLSEQFLRELNY
jgi:hypothetical protein